MGVRLSLGTLKVEKLKKLSQSSELESGSLSLVFKSKLLPYCLLDLWKIGGLEHRNLPKKKT